MREAHGVGNAYIKASNEARTMKERTGAAGCCYVVLIILVYLVYQYSAEHQEEKNQINLCDPQYPECDCQEIIANDGTVWYEARCSCQHTNTTIFTLPVPTPLPQQTRLLYISKCNEVIVSPADVNPKDEVSSEHHNVPVVMHINGVQRLSIYPGGFFSAEILMLENIDIIPCFPAGVFQPESLEIRKLQLTHVTIANISSNAFAPLSALTIFEWRNVYVKTIEQDAIHITGLMKSFMMEDCEIEFVDTNGITITGAEDVILSHTSWTLMKSHSIRVVSKYFVFMRSVVSDSMDAFALGITAHSVHILGNFFSQMKSHALYNIHPPEQNVLSNTNDIDIFEFSNNTVGYAYPGSLNPNWSIIKSEEYISSINVTKNMFQKCSCLGWMWDTQEPSNVHNTYYMKLMDPTQENICKEEEGCVLYMDQLGELFMSESFTLTCNKHDSPNDQQLCKLPKGEKSHSQPITSAATANYFFITDLMFLIVALLL